MTALLPAKRDGNLFDLALHHWKQPIENMFAVQAPPSPAPVWGCRGQEIRSEWWR
jgi:hypothetical protein